MAKLQKITVYGPTWYRRLVSLAQLNLNVVICRECHSPRVDGLICAFCGNDL